VAERESERIRDEARRLREKGRAATSRRDFSWQRADESRGLRQLEDESTTTSGGSRDMGSRFTGGGTESVADTRSEVGTKVYKHSVHIPGTSSSDFAYAEEKRKKRNGAGHRRGREGASGSGQ
jgi:hypothetical protein